MARVRTREVCCVMVVVLVPAAAASKHMLATISRLTNHFFHTTWYIIIIFFIDLLSCNNLLGEAKANSSVEPPITEDLNDNCRLRKHIAVSLNMENLHRSNRSTPIRALKQCLWGRRSPTNPTTTAPIICLSATWGTAGGCIGLIFSRLTKAGLVNQWRLPRWWLVRSVGFWVVMIIKNYENKRQSMKNEWITVLGVQGSTNRNSYWWSDGHAYLWTFGQVLRGEANRSPRYCEWRTKRQFSTAVYQMHFPMVPCILSQLHTRISLAGLFVG